MIIPENTYVTLPNIAVMWSEIFVNGIPNIPSFNAPGIGYEVTVFGNLINDDWIVGLVFITQSTIRITNGYISDIDLATGFFWIGGTASSPQSGIKARINDPVGTLRVPPQYFPN